MKLIRSRNVRPFTPTGLLLPSPNLALGPAGMFARLHQLCFTTALTSEISLISCGMAYCPAVEISMKPAVPTSISPTSPAQATTMYRACAQIAPWRFKSTSEWPSARHAWMPRPPVELFGSCFRFISFLKGTSSERFQWRAPFFFGGHN